MTMVVLAVLDCRYILVIPDGNKNDVIQGAGWLGKNDVT